jgi:hypothetical protein
MSGRTCECGGWKLKDAPKCFRCEARDDDFELLDTLIAMGYGDKERKHIPSQVIELAKKNPLRPPLTNDVPRRGGMQNRELPPCTFCGSKRRQWCGTQTKAWLVYRCCNCRKKYRIPVILDEAIAS